MFLTVIDSHTHPPIGMELIMSLRMDAVLDTDKKGRSPLHWAAACGAIDSIKFLLQKGCDVFQRDSRNATPKDYVQVWYGME